MSGKRVLPNDLCTELDLLDRIIEQALDYAQMAQTRPPDGTIAQHICTTATEWGIPPSYVYVLDAIQSRCPMLAE